jgi:hypothetical protein
MSGYKEVMYNMVKQASNEGFLLPSIEKAAAYVAQQSCTINSSVGMNRAYERTTHEIMDTDFNQLLNQHSISCFDNLLITGIAFSFQFLSASHKMTILPAKPIFLVQGGV